MTPNLTLTKNVAGATWHNTFDDLGSDHRILVTHIPRENDATQSSNQRKRLVDWDKFREIRGQSTSPPTSNIKSWCENVISNVREATQIMEADIPLDRLDSNLMHLWQAKESLQARWRKQRHQRGLRKKIAQLNKDIEAYCRQLNEQQWEEICRDMGRQLGASQTWKLLRFLLDPTNTKTEQRHTIRKLTHDHKGNVSQLIEDLKAIYVAQTPPV
ncbi:hypothetical protein HPB52_000510 [Rhipicephalus sanguineus]|uniref:Tick transposon n=1 Tax=Rhipicephalus sanguineus TaxID=34632 RepID=A0A9D4PC30_RHISA|nr:hypothetical protein HPB52_000510 [Rhipicephalus sanguineus]